MSDILLALIITVVLHVVVYSFVFQVGALFGEIG